VKWLIIKTIIGEKDLGALVNGHPREEADHQCTHLAAEVEAVDHQRIENNLLLIKKEIAAPIRMSAKKHQ